MGHTYKVREGKNVFIVGNGNLPWGNLDMVQLDDVASL
jgi:hypothetical protein